MGGISGIISHDGPLDAGERRVLGDGSSFSGEGVSLVARPRSTLARNDRLVVLVSGHFDRAPATGLGAADALLEAWDARGIECLASFEGAWVAAVYERERKRLHLVRDPFGVRRLYWARKALPTGGVRVAFSNQPRQLLDLPWVSRELARENLAEYLNCMDTLPEAATIRAMHAEDLSEARDKLFDFLCGWLGGPQRYVERHGHPRLRARHLPFRIATAEAESWMLCMRGALEVEVPDVALRTQVERALERLAGHMRNTDDP